MHITSSDPELCAAGPSVIVDIEYILVIYIME